MNFESSRLPSSSKPYNKKRKIIKRVIISVVCLLTIALLIIPPIAVHIITSGHVDYGVIEDHPLQNMYSPLDFDLTANEMMFVTARGRSYDDCIGDL